MLRLTLILLVVTMCCGHAAHFAHAGIGSTAVRHSGRMIGVQAGKQASKAIANSAAAKTANQVVRQATARSAARMTATATRHFGDDVTRAGTRVIDDFAAITGRVTGQQKRRLLMMGDDLAKRGQTQTMMGKLSASKSPGKLIDAMWDRRVPLATAAGAATVMIHGDDIASAGGEFVVKPMVESVVAPVAEASISLAKTVLLVFAPISVALVIAWQIRHSLARRLSPFLTVLAPTLRR